MIQQHQMPNKNHSDPESSAQGSAENSLNLELNVFKDVSVRKYEDYLIFNEEIGLAIHVIVNNKNKSQPLHPNALSN